MSWKKEYKEFILFLCSFCYFVTCSFIMSRKHLHPHDSWTHQTTSFFQTFTLNPVRVNMGRKPNVAPSHFCRRVISHPFDWFTQHWGSGRRILSYSHVYKSQTFFAFAFKNRKPKKEKNSLWRLSDGAAGVQTVSKYH